MTGTKDSILPPREPFPCLPVPAVTFPNSLVTAQKTILTDFKDAIAKAAKSIQDSAAETTKHANLAVLTTDTGLTVYAPDRGRIFAMEVHMDMPPTDKTLTGRARNVPHVARSISLYATEDGAHLDNTVPVVSVSSGSVGIGKGNRDKIDDLISSFLVRENLQSTNGPRFEDSRPQ